MNEGDVRAEFGKHASSYLTSAPHARGASIARLLELVAVQPDWQVLDVATGAGHTAFAFAPRAAHVYATDITREMLVIARKEAHVRGLTNVSVQYADAMSLPYPDKYFHLVTCRIATHHFVDVRAFIRESARVLRKGGVLAVVDNVVPSGAVGAYVNALSKLHDHSHVRCLTMPEWRRAFLYHGFVLQAEESVDKQLEFQQWAARHDSAMQQLLLALLMESSKDVRQYLRPGGDDSIITFHLQEGIIIGSKVE